MASKVTPSKKFPIITSIIAIVGVISIILVISANVTTYSIGNTEVNASNGPSKISYPDKVFPMNGRGNKPLSGKVTVKDVSGTAYVLLYFPGVSDNDEEIQPAYLYEGTCEQLGKEKYKLTSPDSGASETELHMSIGDAQHLGNMAAVVRESSNNQTIISCGSIEM